MKRLILFLMMLPSLVYGQGAIIDQPTRTAGQISNTAQAWLPIWDQNGGARLTFKLSLSELASIAGGLTNGDKGDITLSGSPAGSVWTVDAGKFALLAHTHTIADVTGLQAALDAKLAASVVSAYGLQLIDDADAATARVTLGLGTAATQASTAFATAVHTHAIADVTNLQTTLNGKAALVHSHAIADVTGLQTALDGKAALAHTHAIADTTGLQAALDGKAALVHTHAASDIASGTFASARFAANTVPHATLSNTSANGRLIGSPSASGVVGEITLGSGLSLSGSTLSASGGTPGGADTQIQFNNAGAFGGSSALTWNGTGVTVASGPIASSSKPGLTLTQTWNDGAVTFTGAVINVTDTASAAASKLLDLQIANSSKASFNKAGQLICPAVFVNDVIASTSFQLQSNSASLQLGASLDVNLFRDAADCLALRRSSNAGILRVYETYTDSTTFSRGVFGFRDSASGGTGTGSATTVLRIGTEKGSVGGTARAVSIVTDGTERWQLSASSSRMSFGNSLNQYVDSFLTNTLSLGAGGANALNVTANALTFGSWAGGSDYILAGGTGATGNTNRAAGNLAIRAPLGTGSGSRGSLTFWAAPSGSSGTTEHTLEKAATIGVTSTGNAVLLIGANDDIGMTRPAANILGITNGSTGPGTLAIDNVQGTNFERLKSEWASNVARIGTSKGGTGTARDFAIITDNTPRITVGATDGVATFSADQIRLATQKTITNSTDTGVAGTICYDSNYIYVATGTNTWKRAALSTW